MNNNNELRYQLGLWRIPGIGPVQFAKCTHQLPSLAFLFEQPKLAFIACGLNDKFLPLLRSIDWKSVDADLAWAAHPSHHIIPYDSAFYPAALREVSHAPPLLFVRGNVTLLNQPQLAMVGSRNPTITGTNTAHQFSKTFAESGIVITSGLALGIDAACHEGALAAKGKTIAVMGTGPDLIYPKRHRRLAEQIAEEGALVSEFPTGVKPSAMHFPRRNRIISGMSMGVLVVEAACSSGSLITARYALEQNREVFAIPGSLHNPLARGCHQLIKQGAKLVETAQDVLEELPQWRPEVPLLDQKIELSPLPRFPAEHRKLLSVLGYETTHIDTLIALTGLTAETVSSILLLLELEGYVSTVPGGYLRVK